MEKVMFHLAFPVIDLEEAKKFYVTLLDCRLGRVNDQWLDLYFFGHQLTLHQRPDQVLGRAQQGVRHFGAILAWDVWETYAARLEQQGATFAVPPTVSHEGTPREQAKLFLRDPSGNGIELKAYRQPHIALSIDV